MIRDLLRFSFVLYLIFPFLFLVSAFRGAWPDMDELRWAFQNTALQAALSASFSLLLGIWGALGLLSFSRGRAPWRFVAEMLCLLPNFLPTLFTLLAVLNLIDPFPMGIAGIVIVHTVLNFGLVAVLLAGMIEAKLGSLAELAWVDGISRWRFMTRVFAPVMGKDLFFLALFVFSVCFGSFAIPLVVGGGRGTTLEVLIYEKIRLSSDWSQAVGIALIQSVFLFVLGLAAARARGTSASRPASSRLLSSPTGAAFILILAGMSAFGYLEGIWEGFHWLRQLAETRGELLEAFAGTMTVGLGTGFLTLALLAAAALLWPRKWLELFLSGYVAPSQALVAFSFLVLSPNDGWWPFLKIPVALVLLFFTALWKMSWQGDLESLREQRDQALVMGASPGRIFLGVLWPQLWSRAAWLSGLAAVWACGDFALSRILAPRDLTLGLVTETLMSGYRLGLASVMSLAVLLSGVLCFVVIYGVCRVLGRRSFS